MFEFLLERHVSDATLMRYRARSMDKKRFDMLEAHLLLCPTCQLHLGDLPPSVGDPGFLHLCRGYCLRRGMPAASAGSDWRAGGSYAS
jgi:hypothetical protein